MQNGSANPVANPVAEALIAAAVADEPADPVTIQWGGDLATPNPPVEWVCEGLKLARGSWGQAAGESYSGKSLLFADLALSVAEGTDALGLFRTRPGRVLWLDYDGQGARISKDRFQRLARTKDIDLAALDRRLGYAWLPSARLDDADALEVFCRILDGIDLAIVDSWRGACPATDEHKRSDVQRVGDTLFRVIEKTGTCVLMVDHTIKPAREGSSSRSSFHDMHGSSAKSELPQWLMMFSKTEGKPTRVRHAKERITGQTVEPFSLTFEDVPRGDDPRWGLRVNHIGPEQEAEETARATALKAQQLEASILDCLRDRPGLPGLEVLAAAIKIRPATLRPVVALLKAEGKVVNRGTDRQPKLHAP